TVLLLRDRARFREASEQLPGALDDFLRLIKLEDGREPADLRSAARLLVNPVANRDGEPKLAQVQAYHLTTELIERTAWLSEKPADRLQDLRDLGERALATGDPSHRALVHTILSDLPVLPESGSVQNASAKAESSAKWSGLLTSRSWHSALIDLRASVSAPSSAGAEDATSGGSAAADGADSER
ncbi:MAG: hypothetical protein ACI841_001222, partial [Planctomycetota bacterium]